MFHVSHVKSKMFCVTCHLSLKPTARATDPVYSPTMHSRLVQKRRKKSKKNSCCKKPSKPWNWIGRQSPIFPYFCNSAQKLPSPYMLVYHTYIILWGTITCWYKNTEFWPANIWQFLWLAIEAVTTLPQGACKRMCDFNTIKCTTKTAEL